MTKVIREGFDKNRWAIIVAMGCLLAALGLVLAAGPAGARCPIDDPDCGPGEEIPPDVEITSGPSSPWGSRTATFTFHSPNGIDPTFECSIDSTADSSYADCSSGDSFTVTSDGSHTFRVRAEDAGGIGSPDSHTWTVDATPPNTTINVRPPDVTNSTSARFSFTSDESATFQCRLDRPASTGTFAPCSSSSSQSYSGLTTNGNYTFFVRAVDQVGNVDLTPASGTWTVDTQGPVVNITSGPNGGSYRPGSTQTWSFISSDATSGVQSVQCKVEASGVTSAFGPCTGASSHSVSNLPLGSYKFSVRATDGLGNVSPVHVRTFSIVPLLTISDVRLTEGNSGTKNAIFTARLSAASQQTITVNYATANGTAAAPGDYAARTGTLTFLPGQTTKSFAVAVKGDVRDEPNETFFVRLSGATSAIIADASGRATIVDND
jgi:hypothetical protein